VPHISLVFREMWDTTALSLWLSIYPTHLAVNIGGIPHLAKNERDMGHPSLCEGTSGARIRFDYSIQWLRSATIGLMREALRAGIYPARSATISSNKVILRNVARSVAAVP
jgi:hypothetical protein